MGDLVHTLAEVGADSREAVWGLVVVWTALAVAVEGVLWRVRPSPSVGLWARGATLALLPALLVVPAALAPWVPSLGPVAPVSPAPAPTASGLAALPGTVAVPDGSDGAAPSVSPSALVEATPPVPWLDVWAGLASLLAVGTSLVALVALAGGLACLARYRRGLHAAGRPARAEAHAIRRQMGLAQPVEVAGLKPGAAPFTVGWWRPLVAVPADLVGEPLRFALAHEIAHVRGGHFGWYLAERVVRALFVWHPLVHVLGRGLALDRERVADAAVVGLWPDRTEPYGRLLTALVQHRPPPLAIGTSSSVLVQRLAAMTRPRPARRRLARVVGLALLAVPLVLAASAVPDPPPQPTAFPVAPAERVARAVATERSATAPSDSLEPYIAWQYGNFRDQWARIDIRLKPGVPRAVAERVAAHYADGDLAGTLVVTYDGGQLTRSTLRRGGLRPPPAPVLDALADPGAGGFANVIASRRARFDGGGVRLEVRLARGEPRSVAERVADFYTDGSDQPGRVVVAYDHGEVVRSTLLSDRTAAPPPPPARQTSPALSDSLDPYIARRFGSYSDRGIRVEIRLRPGVSRAVAERVATHYADGDLAGVLVVTYDGGQLTRSTLRRGGLPPPPPVPLDALATPGGGDFANVVAERRAVYDDGDPRVEIRLVRGEPRSTAERVADFYADGDRPGYVVVEFDGGRVERRTLRADRLPPPAPASDR